MTTVYTDRLRAIVAARMLAGTPLEQALNAAADVIDGQARGLDALTERVEALEDRARAAAIAAGVPQDASAWRDGVAVNPDF